MSIGKTIKGLANDLEKYLNESKVTFCPNAIEERIRARASAYNSLIEFNNSLPAGKDN